MSWLFPTCALFLCLSTLPYSEAQHKSKPGSRPNALRVHYPYNFFSPNENGKNWRSQHIHSSETLRQSSIDSTKLSLAQDQEDIWLYENWFYGMENGIIMESGALDGIRYSTSFFFETFLKWTSIHIGVFFFFSLIADIEFSTRQRLIQGITSNLSTIERRVSISMPRSAVRQCCYITPVTEAKRSKAL
jgi:hypothetical protein